MIIFLLQILFLYHYQKMHIVLFLFFYNLIFAKYYLQ